MLRFNVSSCVCNGPNSVAAVAVNVLATAASVWSRFVAVVNVFSCWS